MASQFDVGITKLGGQAVAEVRVDPGIKLEISKLIGNITGNKDLMQKIGLKACTGCKSGLDNVIRDRFEHIVKVNV